MHRRIVAICSIVLFGLVAVIGSVLTDFNDRSFPTSLGATTSVRFDFARSSLSDVDAFHQLQTIDRQGHLGLMRVAPDLAGRGQDRVYISVGTQQAPRAASAFDPNVRSQVRGSDALTTSYPTGDYLITGTDANTASLRQWLNMNNVESTWHRKSTGATLSILTRQSAFGVAILAACLLLAAIVLYWLTVQARGRSLRVLAGASVMRVQVEDLCGVLVPMVGAALTVLVLAGGTVAVRSGGAYLPGYLTTTGLLFAIILGITLAVAILMSLRSLPAPATIARREPGVLLVRKIAATLKVTSFVLVVVFTVPAITALQEARQSAADLDQWRRLSTQARIAISASGGEAEFQRIKGRVGSTVGQADDANKVAFSYSWTRADIKQVSGVDAPTQVALVNKRWLQLMGHPLGTDGCCDPATVSATDPVMRQFLVPNLQLWNRKQGGNPMTGLAMYEYHANRALPVAAAGSAELSFPRDVLLIVADDLTGTFNDDFLASAVSTGNIMFEGVDATSSLLRDNNLGRNARVVLAAESGVERAQYANYFAWLRGISMVAMVAALLISVVVSALISALVARRRDLPLRLHGTPPTAIVLGRLLPEWAVIVGVTLLVVSWRGFESWWGPTTIAVASIVGAGIAQLAAARWCFDKSLQRVL